MKIKRVVTDLIVNGNIRTYKLNGVPIWLSANSGLAGIDPDEPDRGSGFSEELFDLCLSIAEDRPGVTIDLKDDDIIFFLKRTKCIK